MKLNQQTWLGSLLILSLVFATSCKNKKEQPVAATDHYQNVKTNTQTACDTTWFPHASTKAPAEGPNSLFARDTTSNILFHRWSWQKFLWLTKPIPQSQGTLPLFLADPTILQVDASMDTVAVPKGVQLVLTDTEQAGFEQAVLHTNKAYSATGNSQTVYYSIHMNSTMLNAAVTAMDDLVAGKITSLKNKAFPVGSFELKVSWVPVEAIKEENRKNYFITKAHFPDATGLNEGNEGVSVAMLGMHVVGIVENHPEFIWATFEHRDMAPNFSWNKRSDGEVEGATAATDKLLFAKGNINTIDGIKWNRTTQSGVVPSKVYDLFAYGVPRDVGGEFMETSQDGKTNFKNIQDINACVADNLTDVWNNYFYNGSIWINTDKTSKERQLFVVDSLGGNIKNATPGSFARGSLNCANVTMETFTQTFKSSLGDINASTLANCFSCHNSESFQDSDIRSPMYISHVFNSYALSREQVSDREIEKLKVIQEKMQMK
ncbi:conserved exported hypothetical protein [Tenacibaculum litopenaei]|uniref:hypothetical protein n=1 Tax=Tenacibaculum litopenaei TaxID=396016 RepID=UPI003895ED92